MRLAFLLVLVFASCAHKFDLCASRPMCQSGVAECSVDPHSGCQVCTCTDPSSGMPQPAYPTAP